MRKIISPLLIALMLSGCAGEGAYRADSNSGFSQMEKMFLEEETTEAYDGAEDVAAEIPEEYNPGAERVEIEQKIIKTGDVTFQTDSLQKTKERIDQIVKDLKGYYASEDEHHYTYKNQYYITIRVPATNFETLINRIGEGVDHFDSKNISATDVTEEFIDVEARIKTKKETEQRYRDILQRANTVGEILEIEEQISYLRSDIESLEGRLKYLKNRVGYSTLTVTFYEEIPGGPKQGYAHKFGQGLEGGWEGFVMFFVALTYFWPFIVIGLIVWFFIRRAIKKRRVRKKAAKQAAHN